MFFLYRIRLFPNQLFIWNITIVTSINWTREIVWVYLRHCDSTFSCKLLLGFLRGVWIGQVWVEVLVQDLWRLLAEVPPLSSSVKEPGTKDHHCLAGTLLQLDLRIRKYEKKNHHQKVLGLLFFINNTITSGTADMPQQWPTSSPFFDTFEGNKPFPNAPSPSMPTSQPKLFSTAGALFFVSVWGIWFLHLFHPCSNSRNKHVFEQFVGRLYSFYGGWKYFTYSSTTGVQFHLHVRVMYWRYRCYRC